VNTGPPCRSFYFNPVPLSQLQLQPVSGTGQVLLGPAPGQSFAFPGFQPIVVRVTDSASPPDPVLGATVAFQTTVLRPGGSSSSSGNGETNTGNPAMPVILSVTETSIATDINGLAGMTPSIGTFSPPLWVNVTTNAAGALLNDSLQVLPAAPSASPSAPLRPEPGRVRPRP